MFLFVSYCKLTPLSSIPLVGGYDVAEGGGMKTCYVDFYHMLYKLNNRFRF